MWCDNCFFLGLAVHFFLESHSVENLRASLDFDPSDACFQYVIEGFSDGFSIWEISSSGDGFEQVVSVKHRSVHIVRIVPTSTSRSDDVEDTTAETGWHSGRAPVVAVVSDEPPRGRDAVNFFSILDGRYFHSVEFESPVLNIQFSRKAMAVAMSNEIAVFDLSSMEQIFRTETYPCPVGWGVFDLGSRWLAYPSNQSFDSDVPQGPVNTYGNNLLDASKDVVDSVASGLQLIGNYGLRALNSYMQPGSQPLPAPATEHLEFAGSVRIVDLSSGGVVAHFRAHRAAISSMVMDALGGLIATASMDGCNINIFRICASGAGSELPTRLLHAFTLVRGLTASPIQSISFSLDSLWLAATR